MVVVAVVVTVVTGSCSSECDCGSSDCGSSDSGILLVVSTPNISFHCLVVYNVLYDQLAVVVTVLYFYIMV